MRPIEVQQQLTCFLLTLPFLPLILPLLAAAAACCCCCCCRGVLCLVLGSIHRARGGPTLQPTVAATVEALVAVASRPVGMAHIWALHGLWLVAGAAGPGYGPHVKQSLQLALELLVSLQLLSASKVHVHVPPLLRC
jgi:hypothetical protein